MPLVLTKCQEEFPALIFVCGHDHTKIMYFTSFSVYKKASKISSKEFDTRRPVLSSFLPVTFAMAMLLDDSSSTPDSVAKEETMRRNIRNAKLV